MSRDALIASVVQYLKRHYRCHTIILFGSYARGQEAPESDMDLLAFTDYPHPNVDTHTVGGIQLDCMLHDSSELVACNAMLQAVDGVAILDEEGLAQGFLAGLSQLRNLAAPEYTREEAEFQLDWLHKTLGRCQKGDPEGDYRRHWMLVDSLEIALTLRHVLYEGPKLALQQLRQRDFEAYTAYCAALRPQATADDLKAWIRQLEKPLH